MLGGRCNEYNAFFAPNRLSRLGFVLSSQGCVKGLLKYVIVSFVSRNSQLWVVDGAAVKERLNLVSHFSVRVGATVF